MTTPVKICNAVSVILGSDVIQSLEDDTDGSRIFANTYDMLKAAIMSKYNWRFLMESRQLSLSADKPVRGWQYKHVIPGDTLSGAPHAVFFNSHDRLGSNQFMVSGGFIYSDYPDIYAELLVNRPESEWPAWFQDLIINALAARVAKAITDQQNTADYYYGIAFGSPSEGGIGGMMGDAMTIDSQGGGNVSLENNVFLNARMGAW